MDAEHLQAMAARDEFWSTIRVLLPAIQNLAAGEFANSENERQVMQLVARVVVAELDFRDKHTELMGN